MNREKPPNIEIRCRNLGKQRCTHQHAKEPATDECNTCSVNTEKMVDKLFKFFASRSTPVVRKNHNKTQVIGHIPEERSKELDLIVVHVRSTVIIPKEGISKKVVRPTHFFRRCTLECRIKAEKNCKYSHQCRLIALNIAPFLLGCQIQVDLGRGVRI